MRAEPLNNLTQSCAAENGFGASMLEALVMHVTCASCVIDRRLWTLFIQPADASRPVYLIS